VSRAAYQLRAYYAGKVVTEETSSLPELHGWYVVHTKRVLLWRFDYGQGDWKLMKG
jgi:hypothetical protein